MAGLAWFRRESFDEMRSMFEDSQAISPRYEAWLSKAEAAKRQFEMRGIRVVLAYLDPNDFPEWCAARGLKLDARARTNYANWSARQAGKSR
ncbi:hypothetical protein [Ramlibacter sp.]|uniref:hypothetical protein n=1 Tax=Ramlibacter sp. TaxID=1917967 RepID=UPI002608AF20|nr:hypothetical protein [Ramlibacter sp.]